MPFLIVHAYEILNMKLINDTAFRKDGTTYSAKGCELEMKFSINDYFSTLKFLIVGVGRLSIRGNRHFKLKS